LRILYGRRRIARFERDGQRGEREGDSAAHFAQGRSENVRAQRFVLGIPLAHA
jgi:hypothetical protein